MTECASYHDAVLVVFLSLSVKNAFYDRNVCDRKLKTPTSFGLQLVGWLNLFNAELSLKRYWRAPRSQELGEEGDYTYRYTVTTSMTPALIWAAMRAI